MPWDSEPLLKGSKLSNMDDRNHKSCLAIISALLGRCDSDQCVFPPTDLYNEGWLLRLVLDWFSRQAPFDHELSFSEGCTWFSEALLPSQFLARFRGDPLSESWTRADGVIGHIRIGRDGKTDTSLALDAKHLVVAEAKMFSRLSAGVTHASYFNQAARYAACVAELLCRADRGPADLERLGLYVLAPAETISYGRFQKPLEKSDIGERVERRVRAYEGLKDAWFEEWFLPTLEKLEIGCLSWESILEHIGSVDEECSTEIRGFYEKCLGFGRVPKTRYMLPAGHVL